MKMNQVMVMPYPGRGHINPLLNLCHVLSYKNLTTVFTVVLTEEWSELIGSDPKPHNLRFATIPNVIPSEINRGTDPIGFFIAAQNNMEIPFDLLLDDMEQPVNLIIADATLKWTLNVGIRRNIPVAAYWPMSASMFTMWYHVDLLQEHQHIYVDLSERGEEYIDYIPGLSPIKAADFPVVDRGLHDILPNLVSLGNKSQSLLLATGYDLEPKAIDAIKHKLKIPVYTFSPNFPLEPTSNLHNHGYFSWLNSKPRGSVLYISMGSYLSVSSAQIDEISAGLDHSGVNFFWASKGGTHDCGRNGVMVEWCDQLRVLSHSSIGGFLSHCGWNSTKESVFSGVPMLTFPITGEQVINSHVIVDDWKIGWKLKKNESLVQREKIAVVVKSFMDSENVERKEIVENVEMLREIVVEKGDVIRDIDRFISNNFGFTI
ncbi:hypothetical protein LXL04_018673 [Taraxacum kok-saghyz]